MTSTIRRRSLALIAGLVLVATAATSSLAAPSRNHFSGDFDLVTGDGVIAGHVTAQLFEPTDSRLVPGSYDFVGVPGWGIRESHSQIGVVNWWYDANNPEPGLGGSNVAFAEGVECLYFGPGDSFCHAFAVMFVDVIDPSLPNQVAFADHHVNGDPSAEWEFDMWFTVGAGDFVLRYVGA
jgi:hypothetical protein